MSPRYVTPELLAPVGSPEALTAAVRCGADAVYLGAGRFHARQHSSPFDKATFADAVAYCHARNVKVHLTLNTLVRESEFDAAIADARFAAAAGVDALIVQDRGLASAIKDAAPTLTLHASTQLSCHTPEGVRQLMNDGFSRVVLAREMTDDEIAACCEVGCEIEAFVHGALCMSVSGQCFLSAVLGGRSGNRGRCAQPCRLPFAVCRKGGEAHDLSLKDMALYREIGRFKEMGVASLKIEGRMKRPEYVAAAVSVYRAVLDGRPLDDTLLADLQSVFSRNGFTDGYFHGRRDRTMFGTRTKEDVTAAPAAQKRLSQLYAKERHNVSVDMTLTMQNGAPLTLTVCDRDENGVSVTGDHPRQSDAPIPDERLTAALQKLGDTPFSANTITVNRDESADAPLSAINALRREAATALLIKRMTPRPVPFGEVTTPVAVERTAPASPAVVVRLQAAKQYSAALHDTCDLVTLPIDTPDETLSACATNGPVAVEVPRGCFSKEETVRRLLKKAAQSGACAAVCHNVGALPLCNEAGLPMIGGFGLHTVNVATLDLHHRQGLCAATLSFELSAPQMRFASQSPLPVGVTVYGRLPLMLLRNCPAGAQLGCETCDQKRFLTDRKGVKFPLMCRFGCAELLNSVPLYLGDKLSSLPSPDFITLYMTDESPEDVSRLTAVFRDAANGQTPPPESVLQGEFTRGLFKKGVE